MPPARASSAARHPFFLERNGSRLFCLLHRPAGGAARGGVLFFAPFAEEMNRSRRMATLLGEALGELGYATLVFDYAGTGDSDGEFAAARWDGWIADGRSALARLREEIDGPVTLVGLRLGAAAAMEVAREAGAACKRIVLWQPVASGALLLTQFLRIRIAAALGGTGDGPAETTAALRERLKAGETLEIAGYALAPDLAEAIEGLRLGALAPPAGVATDWLEVAAEDGAALSPAGETVIERWRETGACVAPATVRGEQFWTLQETTVAPALIAETARRIATGDG